MNTFYPGEDAPITCLFDEPPGEVHFAYLVQGQKPVLDPGSFKSDSRLEILDVQGLQFRYIIPTDDLPEGDILWRMWSEESGESAQGKIRIQARPEPKPETTTATAMAKKPETVTPVYIPSAPPTPYIPSSPTSSFGFLTSKSDSLSPLIWIISLTALGLALWNTIQTGLILHHTLKRISR